MNAIRRFRLKWPWEQDRQMAVYNSSSHLIQGLLTDQLAVYMYVYVYFYASLLNAFFSKVASQPDRAHMISNAGLRSHTGQWLQTDSKSAASKVRWSFMCSIDY